MCGPAQKKLHAPWKGDRLTCGLEKEATIKEIITQGEKGCDNCVLKSDRAGSALPSRRKKRRPRQTILKNPQKTNSLRRKKELRLGPGESVRPNRFGFGDRQCDKKKQFLKNGREKKRRILQ